MASHKNVELLLLENVDNLGIVGDVVKVKPGYARNYLVPHGLATVPTQAAIERLKERRRQVEEQLRKQRAAQEQMMQKMDGHEITVERAANDQGVLFGSVTQRDVADALREEGYEVEDRFVRLGEQIKRLDSYQVPIVIDKELKCEVKLWVVSDRPADELEGEEDEEGEEAEAAEGDEAAGASQGYTREV